MTHIFIDFTPVYALCHYSVTFGTLIQYVTHTHTHTHTHTQNHPCFRNSPHFKTVCNIKFNNLDSKCVLDHENICAENGNINEPMTIWPMTENISWMLALLAACEWVVPDFPFLQIVGYVCLLCISCTHIPMDSLTVVRTVHIITACDCSEAAAKRN